jgi:hypothetical protein
VIGREFTKSDRMNQRHLSVDFSEFVAERFVLWSWVQKILDRAFKEQSDGEKHHFKGVELIN